MRPKLFEYINYNFEAYSVRQLTSGFSGRTTSPGRCPINWCNTSTSFIVI